MNLRKCRRGLLGLALLSAVVTATPRAIRAQEIDFGRISAFESAGTGTVHGGSPPKTLVDDDRGHAVILTVWDSDTDAKVFWKPLKGGAAQSTIMHGNGVRAFQTDGLFKIQALGAGDHEVKYDYVLLHLRKG